MNTESVVRMQRKLCELQEKVIELQTEKEHLMSALHGVMDDIQGLISESYGVSGLHLNGDVAPWDEILPGGRFERLTHMIDADCILTVIENGTQNV